MRNYTVQERDCKASLKRIEPVWQLTPIALAEAGGQPQASGQAQLHSETLFQKSRVALQFRKETLGGLSGLGWGPGR